MPLYQNSWRAYTVVISILEAAAASTAALSIFFKYRALWQDSFPKRAGCSVLLAAAVCGMHYIALAGTRWKFKEGADWRRIDGGKDQSVKLTIGTFPTTPPVQSPPATEPTPFAVFFSPAISVMCLVIIIASLGLAVRDFWRARKISTDARQIVLASAAFDKMGRMLVKMDGTLPLVVIETDAVLKVRLDLTTYVFVRLGSDALAPSRNTGHHLGAQPAQAHVPVAVLALVQLADSHPLPLADRGRYRCPPGRQEVLDVVLQPDGVLRPKWVARCCSEGQQQEGQGARSVPLAVRRGSL